VSTRVAGIILAAGASERMGRPKALLALDGETFVERLIRVLSAHCDPVVVVLGHHLDEIRRSLPESVQIVVNPDPARGQLSSLQTALRAVPEQAEGFAFIPVDCPAVAEATVGALAKAFERRADETLFVIPRLKDRRGHPVFASRAIAQQMLALEPTDEARRVVHANVARTQYVDVDDAGIFADIDTPRAYQELLQSRQP
jgi:molybdenum cofactor cytidylyltransferase